MNPNKSSEESLDGWLERRRFLLAGATGIATTFAGCDEDGSDQPDQFTEATSNDSETPTVEPPESAAATFQRADESYEFDFEDLIDYQGFEYHDSSSEGYYHPDSRIFLVEIDSDAIHLTLENAHVKRDLDVGVEFNVAGGGTQTTDTKTIETNDDFATHELSFDIDADLPELAPGFARPIADDTHEGATVTRLLKVHRYIAIPYDNADGGGVHYLNSEEGLNHQAYYHTDKEFIVNHGPDERQARHEFETSDDYTVFLAAVQGNNVFGGSTTILKSDLQRYGDVNSRPRNLSPPVTIYNAPDLTRFKSFAQQLGESMNNAGIDSQFGRLSALATIVQTIPYQEAGHAGDSPLITITQNHANCTERTFIYMALANCAPFDTRTAAIHCNLGSLGAHQVVGIDERDLGNPSNSEEIRFVQPSDVEFSENQNQDCLPNTQYAYLELTSEYPIGQTSESLETIQYIRGTSDLSCSPDLR